MDYNVGHATSQHVAADVILRETELYSDPAIATSTPTLCADEAAYFKTHGFIVKRGLIDDDGVFGRVVNRR